MSAETVFYGILLVLVIWIYSHMRKTKGNAKDEINKIDRDYDEWSQRYNIGTPRPAARFVPEGEDPSTHTIHWPPPVYVHKGKAPAKVYKLQDHEDRRMYITNVEIHDWLMSLPDPMFVYVSQETFNIIRQDPAYLILDKVPVDLQVIRSGVAGYIYGIGVIVDEELAGTYI